MTQPTVSKHWRKIGSKHHEYVHGWLEFAGVKNDGPSKNGGGWNLQDWKITDEVTGVEFARLKNDGLEHDGVEREQTYILHPMKNFNVYDM